MSNFNAVAIAKGEKVLEQEEGLKEKILEEISNIEKPDNAKDHAKNIMEVLFRLQAIRPEYLASPSDLSNQVFSSPEEIEAFISVLKEYKEKERQAAVLNTKGTGLSEGVFNTDSTVMFLNPEKIDEIELPSNNFAVGEEAPEVDVENAPEIPVDKINPNVEVTPEEIAVAAGIGSALDEDTELNSAVDSPAPSEEQNPFNHIDFKELSNETLSNRLKDKNIKTAYMQDLLKDFAFDKYRNSFVDTNNDVLFRIDSYKGLKRFRKGNGETPYHAAARVSTGPRPSKFAIKAALLAVDNKTIRAFPSDPATMQENLDNFRDALIELKEEGLDINDVKVSVLMNRKTRKELNDIIESVKNGDYLTNNLRVGESTPLEKSQEAALNKELKGNSLDDYENEQEELKETVDDIKNKGETGNKKTSDNSNQQDKQEAKEQKQSVPTSEDNKQEGKEVKQETQQSQQQMDLRADNTEQPPMMHDMPDYDTSMHDMPDYDTSMHGMPEDFDPMMSHHDHPPMHFDGMENGSSSSSKPNYTQNMDGWKTPEDVGKELEEFSRILESQLKEEIEQSETPNSQKMTSRQGNRMQNK